MELTLEKFENEEFQNNNSQKKNSFNINEIKAYLENNNNLDELDTHLLTDVNNNFSSRRNILQQSGINDNEEEEDLVMNQNYNYNPLSSLNSSRQKNQSQKILEISPNQNRFINNNHVNNSEIRTFKPRIFAEISTKKSTKTSISIKDKQDKEFNLSGYNYENEDEDNNENTCNYQESCDEKDNDINNNINNNEIINNDEMIEIKNYENEQKREKIENNFNKKDENMIKISNKEKQKEKKSKNNAKSDKKEKTENKVKKITQKNYYVDYKEYEQYIIKNEENILNIVDEEDVFGKYVDNIIKRSYNVYKNRQCPSCANLLTKGKSCIKCPKYHHLIKSGKN